MNRTRSRFSPLRLIEDWDAHYWEVNQDDQSPTVVPKRTRVAWWCQRQIDTTVSVWQVLFNPKPFPDTDLSRAERAFLKTKAVLCLILDLDGKAIDPVGYQLSLDALVACDFDFESYGTPDGPGGSCEQVQVGRGYFEHWYAFRARESWP